MKKSVFAGALVSSVIALVSVVGCSAAPDEEEKGTTEDALGRDPAHCVYQHHYREWNTTCQYANATFAQQNAIANIAINAGGVGSCAEVVIFASATVGSATVAAVPITLGAYALATAGAASCGAYIATLINNIVPSSCVTTERAVSSQTRYNKCAMACGGSERVTSSGDCYCGVGNPLACQDAPAGGGTATPPAPGCYNNGNGQSVARGACTYGYDHGVSNGKVYQCKSAGQDWKQCPSGTSIYSCNARGC